MSALEGKARGTGSVVSDNVSESVQSLSPGTDISFKQPLPRESMGSELIPVNSSTPINNVRSNDKITRQPTIILDLPASPLLSPKQSVMTRAISNAHRAK